MVCKQLIKSSSSLDLESLCIDLSSVCECISHICHIISGWISRGAWYKILILVYHFNVWTFSFIHHYCLLIALDNFKYPILITPDNFINCYGDL